MSDHGVRYMVATADPDGFWLMQCGETDPNYWAYMELLCPIDEITRLRAELAAAKERIKELGGALELLAEGVVGRPMTGEQRIARRALEGGER